MFLVQLLLPLYTNDKKQYPKKLFSTVREVLLKKFGGVAIYAQAPAQGIWYNGRRNNYDDIVIVEVMEHKLHSQWWRRYRKKLEKDFKQQKIAIRASRF